MIWLEHNYHLLHFISLVFYVSQGRETAREGGRERKQLSACRIVFACFFGGGGGGFSFAD